MIKTWEKQDFNVKKMQLIEQHWNKIMEFLPDLLEKTLKIDELSDLSCEIQIYAGRLNHLLS